MLRSEPVDDPPPLLRNIRINVAAVDHETQQRCKAKRQPKHHDLRTCIMNFTPQATNYKYPHASPHHYVVRDATTTLLANDPRAFTAFAKENVHLFLETNFWTPTNQAVAMSEFFHNVFTAEIRPTADRDYRPIKDALDAFNSVYIFILPGYGSRMTNSFAGFHIPAAARKQMTVFPHLMLDFNALKKRINLSAKDHHATVAQKRRDIATDHPSDAYVLNSFARTLDYSCTSYLRIARSKSTLFYDLRLVNSLGPPFFTPDQPINHDELDVTTMHWNSTERDPLSFRAVIELKWNKYWSSRQFKRAFLPPANRAETLVLTPINKFAVQQNHSFFLRPDKILKLDPEEADYNLSFEKGEITQDTARVI